MQPASRDIEFTRGDGYSHLFAFKDDQTPPQPLFWVGMVFTSQIRRGYDDTDVIDFDIDDSNLAAGELTVSLPATVTATMSGAYVWDMQFLDGTGEPVTLLTGKVYVALDVTRLVGS